MALPAATTPSYTVPPGTLEVQSTATSTTPTQLEFENNTGLPDVFGSLDQALHGSTVSTAQAVAAPVSDSPRASGRPPSSRSGRSR
ncbi:hypothetical protein GXW82_17415 [Streptacidiphilus sp. 4-A2]|nr:hypothetical protein [Streptacidiphilus sp. 4-A2]